MVANPMNPKDVWLGTSNGGVWYSTNATEPGMNWKPMSDGFSSMAIGAIALANCDAERCNTIYVGTGENSIRRDTYYGSGMFKISWSGGEFPEYYLTPLGSTETLFFGGSVNNILLDGSNIYITLSEGRTSSGSQSTVIAPEPPIGYGIFHSADEGATWTRVGTQPDVLPTDLERRDNFLYAGFMGRGIYRYDLSAGNSGVWCPINPGVTLPAGCVSPGATGLPNPTIAAENFNHVEFEFAPSNPDIMYAMFGTSPEIRVQSARPLLYKSTNGGTNWSRINYTTSFQYGMQTYSYYTHTLAIHPTDANTIYVGGMKLNRSTDSGLTFQDVAPGQIHPDHHDLIFPDPTNADVIYNLDDGGFYYSFDGGSCWLSGNYDLQIAGFYSVSADIIQEPGQPATEFVHGGAQDNGTNLFIGGRVWKHTLDGDGGDGGVRDGNVFYASMQRRFSTDGKFYRSTSGGDLGSFSNIPGAVGGVSSFYPPFAQHQGTADIYTVTDRVYKSTFATNTWTQVSPEFDASPTIYPAIETENTISAFAVAPTNNNRIYVGLYNGAIWRSNGAPCMDFSCWTEIAGPNIGGDNLPDGTISSIDVHPGNENIIYLTYSAFNRPGGQVWLSVNGGTTWVSVSSGLPANLPMNVLKINPGNPQMLWLGSDRGVYRSMDGGSSWEHFGPNRGMPNVAVYDFAIDNSRGRVCAAKNSISAIGWAGG